MNPNIQSGSHPDVEILSAFAEQALSGTEREQVLAHMAVCGRCREVVFLAQEANAGEEHASVETVQESRAPLSRKWFGGWRWAWVPLAALAGLVSIAVVQHVRKSGETSQVARNASPPETMQEASPTQASTHGSSPSAMQQAPKRAEQDRATSARDTVSSASIEPARVLQDKELALQKDESARTSGSIGAGSAMGSGTMQRTIPARARSSAAGGPMAQNEYQQNNAAQNQLQTLAQSPPPQQTSGSTESNKPKAAAPLAHTAMATVDLQAGQQPSLTSAGIKALPQAAPMNEGTSEVAADRALKKTRVATKELPSGLGVLSQAVIGHRLIALDTAGALYITEDGAKHWQPVAAQWTGRAVLVKAHPISGIVTGNVLSQKPARFELVTDKLETWSSTDGKAWTAEIPNR